MYRPNLKNVIEKKKKQHWRTMWLNKELNGQNRG